MTEYCGRVPLILKLNGKTNIASDAEATSPLFASVEDAVRLGADAVGYTMYVGSPRQHDEFRQFEKVRQDCERYGMPLVMWAYPRGSAVNAKGGTNTLYAQDYAPASHWRWVPISSSCTSPTTAWSMCRRPTTSCRKMPVPAAHAWCVRPVARWCCSPAARRTTMTPVLRKVEFYMQSGANGVMFGRNMWLRPFEQAVALTRQVHDIMAKYPR
jgi:class I fructose-bisphosphate aldolase